MHFVLRWGRVINSPPLNSWWRHQMETFSALLVISAGNSPVTGELPTQRSVTRSFDVFFDLRLNKRLSSETPSWSLWRQCNVTPGPQRPGGSKIPSPTELLGQNVIQKQEQSSVFVEVYLKVINFFTSTACMFLFRVTLMSLSRNV